MGYSANIILVAALVSKMVAVRDGAEPPVDIKVNVSMNMTKATPESHAGVTETKDEYANAILAALGKPILWYLDQPGIAEPQRMILTLGGIEFENKFLKLRADQDDPDSWAKVKPTTQWKDFPFMKMTGDGGIEAIQATAICRFLGKVVTVNGQKLYPDDPVTALRVDMFLECAYDFIQKVLSTIWMSAEERATKFTQFLSEDGDLTAILSKLEANTAGDFFLGNAMTVADVYFAWEAYFMSCGFFGKDFPAEFLDKYPKLTALKKNVIRLPQLQSYFSKKVQTSTNGELYKAFVL